MRAVSRKLITAAVTGLAIVAAIAISGCGATRSVSNAIDPVARAADVTVHAPGYHLTATIRVTSATANVNGTMSGVIDTVRRAGALTIRESLAGHTVSLAERVAGTTVYMRAPNQPALLRLTGGKPWLKMDLNRALGALGFGALPTQSSNPAQFVDYLRAVSAKTTRVGSETIGGVQTTHYHAVTDLDKYSKLFPASRHGSGARGIANLETIMGGHTMPMDVWIDSHQLVRRVSFGFTECIQNQHLHTVMTMNMSGYGPQSVPPAPAASQAYDITPLIAKEMKNVKLTCGAQS